LSASASLKLALVNLYLNVFGGFEGGIKFLVDTMFPEKVQNIFSGLFASYKQQVTISMKGDEVRALSCFVSFYCIVLQYCTSHCEAENVKKPLPD
jgi:hypothetical protein